MLGAASSESFPVPPPAPPACSRQEARWGSSRDTDLADHVLGGGPIWKRAEEGQGRSCWPPPAWHRAPASPPIPLRAAPPPQPSTALPHPNVPNAHTPRRPRHPRHQLRAAGRTTSSVPRAQQESRHVSTPHSGGGETQRAMHHPRHRNHCGVAEPGAPRPRTAANRRRHRRRRAGMGRDAAARPRPAAPRERRRLGKDPTRPTWGCGSRATHPEPERGLGLEKRATRFPSAEASGWMGAVSCG